MKVETSLKSFGATYKLNDFILTRTYATGPKGTNSHSSFFIASLGICHAKPQRFWLWHSRRPRNTSFLAASDFITQSVTRYTKAARFEAAFMICKKYWHHEIPQKTWQSVCVLKIQVKDLVSLATIFMTPVWLTGSPKKRKAFRNNDLVAQKTPRVHLAASRFHRVPPPKFLPLDLGAGFNQCPPNDEHRWLLPSFLLKMPQKDVENGPTWILSTQALKHCIPRRNTWELLISRPDKSKVWKMMASCDFIFSNSNHCIKISHHHSVMQLTLIAVSSVFNFCTWHTKFRTNLRNKNGTSLPQASKTIKKKQKNRGFQKPKKLPSIRSSASTCFRSNDFGERIPQPPQWIWWHRLQPWSSNSTSVEPGMMCRHVMRGSICNDKW